MSQAGGGGGGRARGPSWGRLGAILGYLGPSWATLARLGWPEAGDPGGTARRPGWNEIPRNWSPLGWTILGRLARRPVLGASWTVLRPSSSPKAAPRRRMSAEPFSLKFVFFIVFLHMDGVLGHLLSSEEPHNWKKSLFEGAFSPRRNDYFF